MSAPLSMAIFVVTREDTPFILIQRICTIPGWRKWWRTISLITQSRRYSGSFKMDTGIYGPGMEEFKVSLCPAQSSYPSAWLQCVSRQEARKTSLPDTWIIKHLQGIREPSLSGVRSTGEIRRDMRAVSGRPCSPFRR